MSKATKRNGAARGAAYDQAMVESGRRVVREHRKAGMPLVGWKNGHLVVMKPESARTARTNKSSGRKKAAK